MIGNIEDIMEVFQDYAYYYNTFYREKDYGAEAADIDRLLKRYGQKLRIS